MSDKPKFTPGPWTHYTRGDQDVVRGPSTECGAVIPSPLVDRHGIISALERAANVGLIAAAREMYDALKAAEKADQAHANCPECEGLEAPELCPECFPAADDARVMRRNALLKAEGKS